MNTFKPCMYRTMLDFKINNNNNDFQSYNESNNFFFLLKYLGLEYFF